MEPNLFAATGLTWPADAQLVSEVQPTVQTVLGTFISDKITITNAAVGPLEYAGGLEAAATRMLARQVNMSFSAQLDDFWTVSENVRRWGNELTSKIVDGFVAKQMPWIKFVTIHEHTVLTYTINSGVLLGQKTGHDRDKVMTDDGTLAYAIKMVPIKFDSFDGMGAR